MEHERDGGIEENDGREPEAAGGATAERMSGLAVDVDGFGRGLFTLSLGDEMRGGVVRSVALISETLRGAGEATCSAGASTVKKWDLCREGDPDDDELDIDLEECRSSKDSVSTGGSLRDSFRGGLGSETSRLTGD